MEDVRGNRGCQLIILSELGSGQTKVGDRKPPKNNTISFTWTLQMTAVEDKNLQVKFSLVTYYSRKRHLFICSAFMV